MALWNILTKLKAKRLERYLHLCCRIQSCVYKSLDRHDRCLMDYQSLALENIMRKSLLTIEKHPVVLGCMFDHNVNLTQLCFTIGHGKYVIQDAHHVCFTGI